MKMAIKIIQWIMEVLKRYHHIVPKWEETSSFEDGEEHSTEHSIIFSTCEGWGALNRKYFGCEMTNHSIWFVLTPILAFDPTGRMIRGGTYFNIPGGKMSLRYSLRLWSQRNNWDARLYYIILVAFEFSKCVHLPTFVRRIACHGQHQSSGLCFLVSHLLGTVLGRR